MAIIYWIKRFIDSNLITFFFIIFWIVAWYSNAIHKTMFNLEQLQTFYLTVILPKIGVHLVNSKYNSPQGVQPDVHR